METAWKKQQTLTCITLNHSFGKHMAIHCGKDSAAF